MSFTKYTPPGSLRLNHIKDYRDSIFEGMTVKLPTGKQGVILKKYSFHAITSLGDYQWVDIYLSDVMGKRFGLNTTYEVPHGLQ